MMKVIDQEYYAWFLFEEAGVLFLDANCNHSAFGYTWMIKLNTRELESYSSGGRAFLNKLAHDIHYSAPAVKGSKSPFKGRDVSEKYHQVAMEAVKRWKLAQNKS
ncbi:MAG: hypothetical protein ACSHX6_04005 [Akkermansiaceae bacterium]